jgi:hypothetical protein
MMSTEDLSHWVAKEAPLLEQGDLNAVMTLCAFVSDFEQFLEDVKEADRLFDEWLETPSELH